MCSCLLAFRSVPSHTCDQFGDCSLFCSFLCWTDLRPTRRLHVCSLLCIISLLDGLATNSVIAVCFASVLCRTGLRPNQRLQFVFHHAFRLLGKHVGFDLLSGPNSRSKARPSTCLCEAGGRHLCSHLPVRGGWQASLQPLAVRSGAMWALLVVLLLLQALTLVLVGHPIGREFLMNILDRIFWHFAQLLRELGFACLRMAADIRNHVSMDSFPEEGPGDSDGDTDIDSDDSRPPPPPPPPPPSAGAGACACQKLSQTKSPSQPRSRTRTPGPHSRISGC